jgi:ribonuclease P protein component
VWRIRDRATFEALRVQGRRVRRGPVSLTWLPDVADAPPRVAYTVTRRFGPAVSRNRMRRRLRAVVHELAPGIPPGSYLIGVAPAASQLSHAELVSTLSDALAAGPGASR